MKNNKNQRGSAVLMAIFIIILLSIGGTYLYKYQEKPAYKENIENVAQQQPAQPNVLQSAKPTQNNSLSNTTSKNVTLNPTKNGQKYRYPSGLFSFNYPLDWTLDHASFGSFAGYTSVRFSHDNDWNTLEISILPGKPLTEMYENIAKSADYTFTKTSISITNATIQKLAYNERVTKHVTYLIPLTYNNSSVNIVFTVTSVKGSDKWLNDVEMVIKSLTVDPTKIVNAQ